MFERASKLKLRFETARGSVSTEDLWDVPLTSHNGFSLDDLAKSLNKKVKENQEESFVVKKSATNTLTILKFDIVKHIIAAKLAEAEKSEKAAQNKVKIQKILEIQANRADTSLSEQSDEDLNKMLEELKA
jgi:hypothetical protein